MVSTGGEARFVATAAASAASAASIDELSTTSAAAVQAVQAAQAVVSPRIRLTLTPSPPSAKRPAPGGGFGGLRRGGGAAGVAVPGGGGRKSKRRRRHHNVLGGGGVRVGVGAGVEMGARSLPYAVAPYHSSSASSGSSGGEDSSGMSDGSDESEEEDESSSYELLTEDAAAVAAVGRHGIKSQGLGQGQGQRGQNGQLPEQAQVQVQGPPQQVQQGVGHQAGQDQAPHHQQQHHRQRQHRQGGQPGNHGPVARTQQKSQKPPQPDGWRVKLYRLNADGTWDDCGTGRIVCLIHGRHDGPPYEKRRGGGLGGGPSLSLPSRGGGPDGAGGQGPDREKGVEGTQILSDGPVVLPGADATAKKQTLTEEGLYRELGEPTLCMRAEGLASGGRRPTEQPQDGGAVGGREDKTDDDAAERRFCVLLQTRVLLRESYQRQGDNIITWCEPFFPPGSALSGGDEDSRSAGDDGSDNGHRGSDGGNRGMEAAQGEEGQPGGGVDLALSFQDNAGCLDIWSIITNVQSRAHEIIRVQGGILTGDGGSDQTERAERCGVGASQPGHGRGGHFGHHNYHQHHGLAGGRQPLQEGAGGHVQGGQWREQQDDLGSGSSLGLTDSVSDVAQAVAAAHIEKRQRRDSGDATNPSEASWSDGEIGRHNFDSKPKLDDGHGDAEAAALSMAAAAAAAYGNSTGTDMGGNEQAGGGQQRQGQQGGPLHLRDENETVGGQPGHGGAGIGDRQWGLEGGGVCMGGIMGRGMLSPPSSPHQQQLHHEYLPTPPMLANLEDVADAVAASLLNQTQRDDVAAYLGRDDCSYLRALLDLFPPAESRDDYHALATLAACIKTVLLLNDPAIIEQVANDGPVFERVCASLEYDPDLRDKANHRWFLSERVRFRTVVLMDDGGLEEMIHRSFRVAYLRDTLLRPTMDEGCLTTLGSLQTFTHADVVKGVMCAPLPPPSTSLSDGRGGIGNGKNSDAGKLTTNDSYLVRVLRMLGKEVRAIREMEWAEAKRWGVGSLEEKTEVAVGLWPRLPSFLAQPGADSGKNGMIAKSEASPVAERSASFLPFSSQSSTVSKPWCQHLAPQDESLKSRRTRRGGCLSFLRELFNMVRTSLQQSERDDFYAMIVLMDVQLDGDGAGNGREENCVEGRRGVMATGVTGTGTGTGEVGDTGETANLLGLLGAVLSDPNADVTERGACLEIASAVAAHDPCLIRRHCLDELEASSREGTNNGSNDRRHVGLATASSRHSSIPPRRPEPDTRSRCVAFVCPPEDLLLSLIFVMSVETDAGVLLQTSELMRILLDTEMIGDNGALGGGGIHDNNEDEMAAPSGGVNGNIGCGGAGGGGIIGLGQQGGPQGHQGGFGVSGDSNPSSSSAGGQGHQQQRPRDPESEQNSFLAMFYEYYVPWLVAPFQYGGAGGGGILCPGLAPPFSFFRSGGPGGPKSPPEMARRIVDEIDGGTGGGVVSVTSSKGGRNPDSPLPSQGNPSSTSLRRRRLPPPPLRDVPTCAVRASFTVELLSFCVRAHCYRMKFFVLRSRVLGHVLGLLGGGIGSGRGIIRRGRQRVVSMPSSGDRCLKLASLR